MNQTFRHYGIKATIRRINAILVKEFIHITRDWQTLFILFIVPIVGMFLYGYAVNLDAKEIAIMIEDPSPQHITRELTERIDAGTMFRVVDISHAINDPVTAFKQYRVKAILRFATDFEQKLHHEESAPAIHVVIDGADQNLATIIRNVIGPMINELVADYTQYRVQNPVSIHSRILYNPEQRSTLFFIPGLMALFLNMTAALLTSLTVTREKERHTLKLLCVSPVRPWEIVIGKVSPYIVLAGIVGIIILVIGYVFFGIHIAGNGWTLVVGSFLYIVTSLSLGLIFSIIASNQQQAMMMVLGITMMPTIILSGFIFPLASMPKALQFVSKIIPATYFLDITRGVILKGIGFQVLWFQLLAIGLLGILFFAIAIGSFRLQS